MGADNQAEKIIDRIERMERMQVEIEDLKMTLIKATAEIAQLKGYKEEADRHIKTIAELRHKNEQLNDIIDNLHEMGR